MNRSEIKRSAIALLTFACTVDTADEEDVSRLLDALVPFDASAMSFQLTADPDTDPGVLAQRAADMAAATVKQQTDIVAATLAAAFAALAIEYKAACPDADVLGFLQRFALHLSQDDEAPGQP